MRHRRAAGTSAAWAILDGMPAQTIPILPTRSFDATAAFFVRLGFAEIGRYPDYLILRRDERFELHFFAHPDLEPKTNEHMCYVRFDAPDEVSALHAAWRGALERLAAPSAKPWGMFEMAVLDVDQLGAHRGGAAGVSPRPAAGERGAVVPASANQLGGWHFGPVRRRELGRCPFSCRRVRDR
jgi:hypothetical protein